MPTIAGTFLEDSDSVLKETSHYLIFNWSVINDHGWWLVDTDFTVLFLDTSKRTLMDSYHTTSGRGIPGPCPLATINIDKAAVVICVKQYLFLTVNIILDDKGRPQLKKNVFFRALPEWWGGGGLPMPEFFGPLSKSAFLVNKKSLFLQKCQCIELLTVFSCPGQLYRWPCHSLRHLLISEQYNHWASGKISKKKFNTLDFLKK